MPVEKNIDAHELENILKSALFRHYHAMVVKLHAVPGGLQAWFDGCPCHEGLLIGTKSRHMRAKALRADGLAAGRCPCSTCRGWEVVDGKLAKVIAALGHEIESNLQSTIEMKAADGLTEALAPEDYATIMQDFSSGVAHLQPAFGIRLRWSTELPWVLMGIAHPLVSRAIHWCRRCLQAYDAKPEHQHHRKSVLFLKVGSLLRMAIEAFIASAEMPEILRLRVAPFHFIPLGDRNIEREHKYLSDIVRPKTRIVGGHWFSVRRLRVLEHRMFVDPVFANGIVDYFMSLKSIKSAIRSFGFERHPLFQEAMKEKGTQKEKAVSNMLRQFLEQVVYRQELGIKYSTFDIARKVQSAKDNAWRAAERKASMKSRAIPTSVEELLLLNAGDHVRAVGSAFGYITMPDCHTSGIELETTTLHE